MPITPTEVQVVAAAESAKILYLSLHTASPGTTGVTASGGTGTSTQVTFDVPAGTYTHFGCWTAVTGGTFLGGNALSATQTPGGQSQILLTITLPVTAT
jgi:hypothetical protein